MESTHRPPLGRHRSFAVIIMLLMINYVVAVTTIRQSLVVDIQPISAAGPTSPVQSNNLPKVATLLRQYTVHSVLFGWDTPIDSGRILTDFMNIVGSQLGVTVSLRSYSFRPRYAPQSYDQRPPATVINEVVSLLPAKAGSGSEVIMIFSSMLLPAAQGGSQAYFLKYPNLAGERNVVIVWGRDGRNLAVPANYAWLPFVTAHEFGHFLGYQHEGDPRCIMYPFPYQGSFRDCKQFPGAAAQPAASLAAPKSACIIATAAFGSEFAPSVALLRSFRDFRVKSSPAGLGFMAAFESWYYSFSPYVADFIGQHSAAREITRAALYPLVGTLLVSEKLQSFLGNDAGILVAGMFAAYMIGLIYFSPLASLLTSVYRPRLSKRSMTYISVAVILAPLPAVLINSDWTLSAGAVALILICLAIGAGSGCTALRNFFRKASAL